MKKLKILLIADPNSAHTIRWAKGLTLKGIDVSIFGIPKLENNFYDDFPSIKISTLNIDDKIFSKPDGAFSKMIYLKAYPQLKKFIKQIKPDILHAYYASSNGLIGALSNFHPFAISVWGSDIFEFPKKSFLHKKTLEFSLSRADKIFSTSTPLAEETKKYTKKAIEVVPFGIDLKKFSPLKVKNIFPEKDFVIGTIKKLEEIYGIDVLIRAFSLVKEKFPNLSLKLLIVGKGNQEEELKKLVNDLNLSESTFFSGFIKPEEIPIYHNMLDIAVFPSLHESFGVAVIEAMACEKPIIVTNTVGFTQIITHEKTGLIVETNNINQLADAIVLLIKDEYLRNYLAMEAKKEVHNRFDENKIIEEIIASYYFMINKHNSVN